MDANIPIKPNCPFPRLISPYKDLLREKLREWINEYDCLTEKQRTKLINIAIESMTAYWYPKGSLGILLLLNRYFLWAFAFDDAYSYNSDEELKIIIERSLKILNGATLLPGDNVFYRHLFIIASELVTMMPRHWKMRFITHVQEFLEGHLLERPFTQAMRVPSMEEYITIRQRSIAVEQMIDLGEPAINKILPAAVFEHSYVKKIRALACRILMWSNDYYSLQKEVSDNDVMNIILVLEKHNGYSREEAIAYVLRKYQEDIGNFIELEKQRPDIDGYNQSVTDQITIVKYIIAGDLAWYEHTGRY